MPKLMTVRKQAWVDRRQPNVVKGEPLNPNAAVEQRYYAAMAAKINRMCDDTARQLERLFNGDAAEEFFAEDASIASQARILTNALTKKFNDLFGGFAQPAAETFANASDKTSSTALHESLKQLSGGLSLPTTSLQGPLTDILKATVTENVGLIKSIPAKYLQGVQGAVMRSITTGNGMQDLVPYLAKHKQITLRRARMIAKDQTRKAFNNLNKGRMEQLGVEKFEWLHTGGSDHPRKLHVGYSGKIFSFDDLPIIDENTGEHGIPGQAINCRCRMVPVIEFEK